MGPFSISFPVKVYVTGTLYFRDERSYRIDDSGRATSIRDRNGNLVTITYSNGGIQITDPIGRLIQVTPSVTLLPGDGSMPYQDVITCQGFGRLLALRRCSADRLYGSPGDLFEYT